MRVKKLFLLLAALASLSAAADPDVQSLVDAKDPRTVRGVGADEPAGYVPPLVANGELAGNVRLRIRADLWSRSNVALPPGVTCRAEGGYVLLVWPL